jgi:Ca2+-transporting ATPase
MSYIIAVHVPIAGLSLVPVLFNMPLILFPMHIALLELIIDPSCTIVFEREKEENDIMNKPPRNPKIPIFGFNMIASSVMMGFGVMIIVLAIYFFALKSGLPEVEIRAMAFATLITGNLLLIVKNRSRTKSFFGSLMIPNKAQWWIISLALFFLALVVYVPVLQSLFKLGALNLAEISICFGAGLLSILWFEIISKIYRRTH